MECFLVTENSIGQRHLQICKGPPYLTSNQENAFFGNDKNLNFRIEFYSFDHSSEFCVQVLSQLDILATKQVIS